MAIQNRMIDRFEVLRVNNPQEYKVLNEKLNYNELMDLGFIRKKDFDNNFSLIELDHTGKVGDLLTVLSTKSSNNRAGGDAVLKALMGLNIPRVTGSENLALGVFSVTSALSCATGVRINQSVSSCVAGCRCGLFFLCPLP